MKILFVLSLGFDRGGPSIHLLTALMEGLAARGHHLHVVEEVTGGPLPTLPQSLRATGRVTVSAIQGTAAEKGSFIKRYVQKLRYARAARKKIEAHRDADLVYVHSCNTLYWFAQYARKSLPGKPLVVNVQDIFPENLGAAGMLKKNSAAYRVLSALQRYAYRRADAIITLSPDMKETLAAAGARPDRIHVIPPWSYSDALFCVAPERNRFLRRYPQSRGFFRVVYAGNVGAVQNVDVLFEAAQLLKDEPGVRLMIVGEGARLHAIEEKAGAAALQNLMFFPMQPPDMALDVYSMADINLITLSPGVVRTAFPSKTATCCAAGRPIIACVDPDSHYGRMIAACDGCYVTPPGDATALAARIRALHQAGTSASMGARALYNDMLSVDAGVEKHAALFEALLKREDNS